MSPRIRRIQSLEDALALAPALEAYVAEATAEFRDEALPEGVCRRFFQRQFAAKETVLLVAESVAGRADLGVCLTGPFEDPLIGSKLPMILILYVSPDHRHRGIARALVDAARKTLEAGGLHSIAARTAHNDDALISMGERWGFVRQWDLMLRE